MAVVLVVESVVTPSDVLEVGPFPGSVALVEVSSLEDSVALEECPFPG